MDAPEQPSLPLLPPAAAEQYQALVAALRSRIVGQEAARRTLALAALRGAVEEPAPRVVILGPPGSGRGHMVRSLAEAMGGWVARVPLADVAETNWSGRSLGQWLAPVALRPRGAVVHLADLDSLAVRPGNYTGETGATQDYRQGKQASVRTILEAHEVTSKADGSAVVETGHLLVIATGFLPSLPDHPSAEDFADAGLSGIAEVLAAATLVRSSPLTQGQVGLVVMGAVCDICRDIAWTGYQVSVDPAVIERVSAAIASGRGTLREGLSWIRAGVEAGVTGLLEAGAPADTHWVLALDDLRIPAPAKGRWAD